ncbi:uncharacterized protein N7446_005589 [Penicillium canescens]|uniref:PNPLA domain-containing protein n=1 Tax=Penicillium canescens TaxID=5083 RepID=A0AAD6II68_PENCN|nr:uncharacterized protein N7446_005589 [Penicillium canescens]KAJ6050172.1 hypothetical protein N7444_006888 [Penicillium canescens]KAJ6050961.1 hypothetical protein N7460_001495 [Penicillium canescens]KAJ6061469.1 hypothetical protein N7446_005589 [Penicillium canescens]
MHAWGWLGYNIGNPWLKFKPLAFTSRFSNKPVIDAINEDVKKSDGPEDHERKASRVLFICATLAEEGTSLLLRSYATQPDDYSRLEVLNHTTINEAVGATSAAPTYMPEVEIQGLRCWDGGLLNNNPIDFPSMGTKI